MKAAYFVETIKPNELDKLAKDFRVNELNPKPLSSGVDFFMLDVPKEVETDFFRRMVPDADPKYIYYEIGVYHALDAPPHIDREAAGKYSIGLVLKGDHIFYVGNGRKVCDLLPGTVFFLNNKKTHGASPRDKDSPKQLIFACIDFKADSQRDAMRMCGIVP